MWILDQGPDSWVSLVNVADGKVIREFKTDVNAASGVTVDEHGVMWISSTHNSLMVSCSPKDGKTIAKYWTPGAGRIYQKKGDAELDGAANSSRPIPPNQARLAEVARGGRVNFLTANCRSTRRTAMAEQEPTASSPRMACSTFVVPPARFLVVMDPKTWVVQTNLAGAGKPNPWADVGRESRDPLECRLKSQRFLSIRHERQDHRKDSAH